MTLDQVRLHLMADPVYESDILEARLRSVMLEQLNITRDIPMERVWRLEGEEWDRPPIVAVPVSQADKWEVLCLARLPGNQGRGGVTITEDIPGRSRNSSRQEEGGSRNSSRQEDAHWRACVQEDELGRRSRQENWQGRASVQEEGLRRCRSRQEEDRSRSQASETTDSSAG